MIDDNKNHTGMLVSNATAAECASPFDKMSTHDVMSVTVVV